MSKKNPATAAKSKPNPAPKNVPAANPPASNTEAPGPRRLRPPSRRALRLRRRIKAAQPKLPTAFQLFGRAAALAGRNWKPFALIILIYGVLEVLLAQALSGVGGYNTFRQSLDSLFSGHPSKLASGLAQFGYLAGSTGSGASASFTLVLGVIVSLVIIWALRHAWAGERIRVRESFYRGPAPLVPFVLVLGMLGVQLLPAVIGGTLYSIVIANGIASTVGQRAFWVVGFLAVLVWSLYMACSALVALYAVCLPDMTPIKAWRSARALLRGRRWAVLRKVLFLPLALLVLAAVIMLPVIWWVPWLAVWLYFVLTLIGLVLVHSYLYGLYRALL